MQLARRILTVFIFAICALICSSLYSYGQAAYTMDRDSALLSTTGQVFTHQNRIGALNLTYELIISGTPTTSSTTIAGCMRSGTCDTLDSYAGTANSNRKITGLYDYYTLSWTFTGGTSPTLRANLMETSTSSPLGSSLDPCSNPNVLKSSVVINQTANTQLVALSAGKAVYACGFSFTLAGTTPTATLVSGTGTTCGTGQAALTGVMAPTSGQMLTAGYGGTIASPAASTAVCLLVGGTSPSAQGIFTYVQQ